METVIAKLFVTTTILPIIYIIYKLISSHFEFQFFQKNLPTLPILEGQKPIFGHLPAYLSPRHWKIYENAHKKYGKYFGLYFGHQPVITTLDLDLIKKFAIDEDHHDRISRLHMAADEIETDCIFTARGEQWRRIRKALAPAFSKQKIMSLNVQDEMNSVINKFVDSIEWRLDKAKREKSVDFIVEDMDEYLQRYALALVFTCLYKKDDLIDFHADRDYWQSLVDQGTRLMSNNVTILPQAFPLLSPIMKIILKIYHPTGKLVNGVMAFLKEQTKLYERAKLELKKGEGVLDEAKFTMKDGTVFRGNMIDYFIGKFMDKKITEREFYHSSFFLFMAANKTSSDALSRLVYLLACHQNVQDKLRESILVDGTESTYLTWVINEVLRLFPPAHFSCSRTNIYPIETKFGTIPEDTYIQVHNWTLHRWPEYWGDDADKFKPERWAKSDTFHPAQYVPFGAGRRICPGKEFALREMRMLVVKLLTRYKFERSEKTTDELNFRAPFSLITVYEDPTWVKISRLEQRRSD